jgi:hypothetical protein
MARELAAEEDVSLNQLITLALAEKISALKSEEFFAKRTRGASRAKFERAMRKVSKAQPAPHDRLTQKRAK